jgi:hypothetical protein
VAEFLKVYGDTLGPLGNTMRDAQASALEAQLKALPAEDRVAHKAVLPAAVRELAPASGPTSIESTPRPWTARKTC